MMAIEDVGDRAAVGNNVSIECPVLPQMFLEQHGVRAGGLPIQRVVGAHHGTRFAFHYGCAKGRKVSVFHVMAGSWYVDRVPCGFRAAVHCKMFWSCNRLQIFRIVPLQSGHKRNPEPGS